MNRIRAATRLIWSIIEFAVFGTFRRLFGVKNWDDSIDAATKKLKSISDSCKGEHFSFVLLSDMHYEPSVLHPNKTTKLGKISQKIMSACDIKFLVNLGDTTAQSCKPSLADEKRQLQVALGFLEPIDTDRILLTVGNHDGATGKRFMNQMTNTQREQVFFSWQKTNPDKVFGPGGTYYYLDDANNRVRYIMLNSYYSDWVGNNDGVVQEIEASFFHKPSFGLEQLTWLGREALSAPEGYAVVVGTHYATEQIDSDFLKDILDSYFLRKECRISSGDGSVIEFDFSKHNGELIAVFHGHAHRDKIDTQRFAVPYIGVTAAADSAVLERRVSGTCYETAMDVVTVDRCGKKIYLTRLGAGEDRETNYS